MVLTYLIDQSHLQVFLRELLFLGDLQLLYQQILSLLRVMDIFLADVLETE